MWKEFLYVKSKLCENFNNVKHIFIFGSFASNKENPDDIDVLVVLNENFSKNLSDKYASVASSNYAARERISDEFYNTSGMYIIFAGTDNISKQNIKFLFDEHRARYKAQPIKI